MLHPIKLQTSLFFCLHICKIKPFDLNLRYKTKATKPWSEGMGVDSKYLILENQSRNTVENVQNSKVIMEEYNFTKPLVITSGFHLPRAMEIFAREGIEATPYVADYQMSDELVFSIFNFLPNNGSLNTSCMAIREYLGILALKLKMQ